MDIYSKLPDFSREKIKTIFLSVFLTVLALGTLFYTCLMQKTEANLVLKENYFDQNEVALMSHNTLSPVSDPASPDPKVMEKITVIVTAYSSTPWETWGDPFITAAGSQVRNGIVANNLFPFGTKIKLPEIYGEKIFVVEDRMHWRKGNYHIDIWFPSYQEALNFGAQKTYIEVLEG